METNKTKHSQQGAGDGFLTPAELAARWRTTPMTLRRWRHAGNLTAYHFGRGVRFKLSEVIAYENAARA